MRENLRSMRRHTDLYAITSNVSQAELQALRSNTYDLICGLSSELVNFILIPLHDAGTQAAEGCTLSL